jgi:hypothetical protein
MRGWNPIAEGRYDDEASTYGMELTRRRRAWAYTGEAILPHSQHSQHGAEMPLFLYLEKLSYFIFCKSLFYSLHLIKYNLYTYQI